MKKCDCYCTEEKIIGWHTPVDPKTTIVSKCNGTRERDECSCGGDRTKCDFYPEVREKALKEQDLKFGEWISVEDRLPEEKLNCLVHYKHAYCDDDGYWAIGVSFYDGNEFRIGLAYKATHWMPLPAPPTEKEN